MTEGVCCVPPSDVPKVWPLVADMIDAAFAELDETTPDYLPWLMEAKGLLWVYIRSGTIVAAATVSLQPARRGQMCRVVAVGGDSGEVGREMWRQCIIAIEAYAKSKGCYKVAYDGRRGWGKVLTDYDPKCVSFEKRI